MLIFYGGGRREEYCGLMTDDVIEDNGLYPYLHIAKNKFRRIKNGQSKRNIVIQPELIRLGFLRYVALIRSLGYELVFPDLFSPTTKSPLGNRYYKLFKPVLIAAGITEEGLGSHAIRHAFGAILKKSTCGKSFAPIFWAMLANRKPLSATAKRPRLRPCTNSCARCRR